VEDPLEKAALDCLQDLEEEPAGYFLPQVPPG